MNIQELKEVKNNIDQVSCNIDIMKARIAFLEAQLVMERKTSKNLQFVLQAIIASGTGN